MQVNLDELDALIREARLLGYLDGLRAYAHWKDGVEYVGSCGERLSVAIKKAKRRELWNQEKDNYPEG